MENDKTRRIGKGLLSIGIGSIVAYYFLQITRFQLLPLSMEIQEMIENGEIQEDQIWEIHILLLGVIATIIAPLFLTWGKIAGYKISAVLFLVFIDLAAILPVIVSGKIFPTYILLIWVTFVLLVWLCIDIIKCLAVRFFRHPIC